MACGNHLFCSIVSCMTNEIEARFLNIDKQSLINKLLVNNALDKGDALLSEVIFYDQENKWSTEGRFVRIRSASNDTKLTYKHNIAQSIDSATEIEFTIPDANLAEQFLVSIGLVAFRHQEKQRHTFELNGVTIDIDTWPNIPTYVELEGPSEEAIRSVAEVLGFDWNDAVYDDARTIIQDHYNIPMGSMRWFTFDRFE